MSPAQMVQVFGEAMLQMYTGQEGKGGGKSALFYGHLYLGLFFDAKKDLAKAKEHLTKCVEVKYPGYMYDVAKLHLKMLEESSPTETKPGQR